jgi:hypothetical protein
MVVNKFINVSVDCVIFGFSEDVLKVLLIEQITDSQSNGNKRLALPGDLVYEEETLNTAAKRVLKELTNLDNVFLKQFHSFGDPNRVKEEKDQFWLRKFRENPDARVITVSYYSIIKMEQYDLKASSFAQDVVWIPVNQVPKLAFDHNMILEVGLQYLRDQIKTNPVMFELLPDKFTLNQLQKLHEIVLNKKLDKRNFRRKMQKIKAVIPLDEKLKGVSKKPSQLYFYDKNKEDLNGDF